MIHLNKSYGSLIRAMIIFDKDILNLDGDKNLTVYHSVYDILVDIGNSSTPIHRTDPVSVYQRYRHHQITPKSVEETKKVCSKYWDRGWVSVKLYLKCQFTFLVWSGVCIFSMVESQQVIQTQAERYPINSQYLVAIVTFEMRLKQPTYLACNEKDKVAVEYNSQECAKDFITCQKYQLVAIKLKFLGH